MSNTPAIAPEKPEADEGVDVSVIIPVYNCERFIEETVNSVRAQTIGSGRYEIVAVDDGSTDRSLSILNELARGKDDLRVFTIPNSGSAAAPRNRGLEEASGRYLFFLDADDKLDRDTLKRLTQTADATGSGVVLCKLGLFGEGKLTRQIPSKPFSRNSYAVDFIDSHANSTLSALKLFRRSIIEELTIRFPLGFAIGEDQPFTLKAFLHSPHVSILADKVFYWVRQRGDGTNVTSVGQSPRRHLDRIMTLTSTIIENTEPGIRRDVLLRRPIVGKAGTVAVFGRKMLPAHARPEREEMLSMYRRQITDLWNPRIRKYGAVASQVLVDLVVRNDLDEIEIVSETLRSKGYIPVKFDRENSQFTYTPLEGDPIAELNVRPRVNLEMVRFRSDAIEISGEVGIEGALDPPDSTQFVLRHRKSGIEVPFNLDVTRTHTGPFGIRSRFHISVDAGELSEPSTWDTFVDVSWGSLTFRENFGNSKAKALDLRPVLFGNPTCGVVFFTALGNLAIDVGPTAVHLDKVHSLQPKFVGRFVVGRSEIVELSGMHSDLSRAEAHSERSGKITEVEVVRHRDNSASVIVPRSVARRGRYSIALRDADDNTITVPVPEHVSDR